MTIIIEIVSNAVRNRSGTSGKGKPYSIDEQEAYVHKPGQAYPDKIRLTLDKGQQPYQPGNYDLHPESFYTDRFGALAVRPVLFPRPAETKPVDNSNVVSASGGKK